MREGIRVREITNDEGRRLLQIVRRSSGSVVPWRGAQMVLLSAQGMDVAQIAKVAFTVPDRIQAVWHNFKRRRVRLPGPQVLRWPSTDLYVARTKGDQKDRPVPPRPSRPACFNLERVQAGPSSWWLRGWSTTSATKAAPHPPGGGRLVQVIETWKQSKDPDLEINKNRVLELYKIADGKVKQEERDPSVVICVDEFGPLNLLPRPAKQWAPVAVKGAGKVGSQDAGISGLPMRGPMGSGTSWPPTTCTRTRSTAVSNEEEPHNLPRVLPLPAEPLPARCPHRHRDGQLQPASVDEQGHPSGRRRRGQ